MVLVALKALAGTNYVRADQVIAVTATEQYKCTIVLTGGVTVPCYEAASDVIVKLGATAATGT
jgi:hypothetical protein